MKLILASQSRARAELLRAAGFRFQQAPSHIREPAPRPGIRFDAHLLHLALLKAEAVAHRFPRAFVIGADTALRFKGRLIGKAPTPAKAVALLRELGGKSHLVGTALVVLPPHSPSGKRAQAVSCYESATVTLRAWDTRRIRAYVRTRKPFHCAGAYALQDGGSAIIESIRGDPSTVVGLPVKLLFRMLKQAGYRVR